MNLWFAPQIFEHCPYTRPGRLIENITWVSRPGVASVFTPSLGTVHECNTSATVTIIRIGEFIGSTTRLSVSSSRNVLVCWSSCCTKSASSSSSSCSWRVRRVSCSLILKAKLIPPSLPRSSYVPSSFLVNIVVLVLVFCLCPSSVRVVATFCGTVLFPLLCSVLPFFS